MSTSQCGPKQFTCDNECLELSRKCDRIRDCLDSSDEENCGYSSVVLSDFDRMAQLGLFISIGVIGLVLVIILAVVFIICMRRNKRRQLASVQVIQVPSHYIKTHDGPHSSTIGSTASGPTNCNNAYREPGNQQQMDGPCGYYGLDQRQGSCGDPVATSTTTGAVPLNCTRSHRSSRRSNRSRRSTSSGRHRSSRHVPLDGSAITQPPSAALSGDSGIAATTTTGSTTVSTSGVAPVRPSSVHSSLHYGRRERTSAIPAAFRHSFHGNQQQQQLHQLPSSQQSSGGASGDTLLQQDSAPILAAASSSSGVLETSPPPPYSTFDRTVYAGRIENSASNEPNQRQQQSSTPLFMSQPGLLNAGQLRNSASSALLRVERNVLYGEANSLSPAFLFNNGNNNNSQNVQRQPPPPRVSPSADYTRMWIERVSADAVANSTPAQPVTASPFREDTLLAEQSYAQQIRQALRKNQSQHLIRVTVSSTPRDDTNLISDRVASQTPQSLASGYLNITSSTPCFTVTPSPTRVVTPQYSQVITRKPPTVPSSTPFANNFQQQSNAPIAIISKRPMPLNV